jgi:hypothetical protein
MASPKDPPTDEDGVYLDDGSPAMKAYLNQQQFGDRDRDEARLNEYIGEQDRFGREIW